MKAPVNVTEKFAKFSDQWSPKIIAQVNDFDIRAVKVEGDFVWHKHDETDELFFVVDGSLRIEFRDGEVNLNAGELYVVPKGVEHKPVAERECQVLVIEPSDTVNTGDASGEQTKQAAWI